MIQRICKSDFLFTPFISFLSSFFLTSLHILFKIGVGFECKQLQQQKAATSHAQDPVDDLRATSPCFLPQQLPTLPTLLCLCFTSW